MLENKKRPVKRLMWEVKEMEKKNALAKKVILELKITANVTKLGAMVSKGYIAKAKGTYAECAECNQRIHINSACECEGMRDLIYLLQMKNSYKTFTPSRMSPKDRKKKPTKRPSKNYSKCKNFSTQTKD
jgi:hypothetical protein